MLLNTLETTYFNVFAYYNGLNKNEQQIFLHNFQQLYPDTAMTGMILNEKHLNRLKNGG